MATNGDLKAHERTYSSFMTVLKWGTVVCFVVAMIVVFLIAG